MKLFGTAGIRGSARERVTPELALAVGRATGAAAVSAGGGGDGAANDDADSDERTPEFVVGRDGRVTGPSLTAAVEAGLTSAGADVVRVGVLPTPALAFASRGRRGVMLTASHNPPTDNGIKLFEDGVEYDRDAEAAVEERVDADERPARWDRWGESYEESPLSDYRNAIIAYVRETFGKGNDAAESSATPLDGLRVAVDCGNGMASVATPQVLEELGADVVALNANVDGHFPGRESKPTPESLRVLREFLADAADTANATDGAESGVEEDGDGRPFDFGIAHDGDADRIVIVGPGGEVVHEDTVVAVLAERYVRSVDADDPVVVTTPNASARIDERVESAGGRVERVRLGSLHEGIASARADGGDVVFAAEPWKHIHTAFGGWIDGVASAAVFATLVASEGLDGLRASITERPYEKTSVDCPDDAKAPAMAALETALPEAFPDAEATTEYGVRLALPDASWVLVRPSGTEPYVRIYVESDEVDRLLGEAREVVESAVEAAT